MALNRHVDLLIYVESSAVADKFEQIGVITALAIPDKAKEMVENTPYGSDYGSGRGFVHGLEEAAELTFTVEYDAANENIDALEAAFDDETEQQVMIRFPKMKAADTTRIQYEYPVKVSKIGFPVDEKGGVISRAITLQVNGDRVKSNYTIPAE